MKKSYGIAGGVVALLATAAFIGQAASSDWCDLKDPKVGTVLYTYQGACGTQKFGGPWGEALQVPNTTRQKIEDDKVAADALFRQAQAARLQKVLDECQKQSTPILLAVCDLLLKDANLK